jgi:RNA polymerase sigma-70 factor (ECF subfamily)
MGRAAAATATDPDAQLLARTRAGEEAAFVDLVCRHQSSLLRLARQYVRDAAVAEEVVQDTWLAVLRGLDGFAERSTFRTWLFSILVNRARSTGTRERRNVPVGAAGPAVDPARFDSAGAWAAPPERWVEDLEERLFADALAAPLEAAVADLPPRQREVLLLRDVGGLAGREVCEVLGISAGNERVLLHRARSTLRGAIETTLGGSRC